MFYLFDSKNCLIQISDSEIENYNDNQILFKLLQIMRANITILKYIFSLKIQIIHLFITQEQKMKTEFSNLPVVAYLQLPELEKI